MLKLSQLGFSSLLLTLLGSLLLPSAAGAQTSDNLTLELLQRVEQLEQEVRHMRGELEFYRHQTESAQRRNTAQQAEQDLADERPQPAAPPQSAAPEPAPAAPERTDLDAALRALRDGNYASAITGLQAFLSAQPDSPRSGDAQYWLGEAYYASQNYQAAKEAFIALGLNHPQNTHLPDALLKLGDSYGQLGDVARAREVLQKLVAAYPATPAANQAAQRLQELP